MLRNEGKLCNGLGNRTGWGGKETMNKYLRYLSWFNPMLEGDGGGGGGGTPPDDPPNDPPADPKGGSEPKGFDDLLKDKDIQAEFDRRMSKGIQTAIAKEKARLEALADEKISEAEKLSKMTELEKKEYQQKKTAAEIEQKERDLTKRELMAEAKNTLSEKSLPLSLAELLNYTDAEACNKSLETVEKAFSDAVKAGVEEKLKGGKPPKSPPGDSEEELEKQILQYMKG